MYAFVEIHPGNQDTLLVMSHGCQERRRAHANIVYGMNIVPKSQVNVREELERVNDVKTLHLLQSLDVSRPRRSQNSSSHHY